MCGFDDRPQDTVDDETGDKMSNATKLDRILSVLNPAPNNFTLKCLRSLIEYNEYPEHTGYLTRRGPLVTIRHLAETEILHIASKETDKEHYAIPNVASPPPVAVAPTEVQAEPFKTSRYVLTTEGYKEVSQDVAEYIQGLIDNQGPLLNQNPKKLLHIVFAKSPNVWDIDVRTAVSALLFPPYKSDDASFTPKERYSAHLDEAISLLLKARDKLE